jgi:hypothetical protein
MLYGKPVIVTDTGCYSEFPDDCVIKVSPENELHHLAEALQRLDADRAFRQSMGHKAKLWAAATFTASNYASQLLEISDQANSAWPTINAARFFAKEVEKWGGSERLFENATVLNPLRIFAVD